MRVRSLFIVLFATSMTPGCKTTTPPTVAGDVTNKPLAEAMTACSVGWQGTSKNTLDAEIKGKGVGLKYEDAKELATGALKDSRPEDRVALVNAYMKCLNDRLGVPAEKKKWAVPTVSITPIQADAPTSFSKPNVVDFRITNHADVDLPVERLALQLITCGGPSFIMSVGDNLGSNRIDLGVVDFKGASVKMFRDTTYTLPPTSTAFFKIAYQPQEVSSTLDEQQRNPCPHEADSRDIMAPQDPVPGEVYLLIQFVRPDNGEDYVFRKRLEPPCIPKRIGIYTPSPNECATPRKRY